MTDPVQTDFRGAIARHFSFLFDEYGFVFVAEMNERAGEYQMQIAAAPDLQIKWILEQNAVSLYLGRPDAPRAWENEQDGITTWHFLDMLLAYEDKIHPAKAVQLPPDPDGAPLDAILRTYAKLLRAYLPRLQQDFSAPPPGWWAGYDAFRAGLAGSFSSP